MSKSVRVGLFDKWGNLRADVIFKIQYKKNYVKKLFKNLKPNTTAYILAHWEWRKSRGKKHPSATFDGVSNPKESLAYAMGKKIAGKPDLKDNPFIGALQVITNPEDGAFHHEPCPRTCGMCYFRDRRGNDDRRCELVTKDGEKHPNELFGYAKDDYMPTTIDGLEIGNYCKSFTCFDVG